MTPTLTEHQWGQVRLAADWYKEADRNRHQFEMFQFEEAYEFARDDESKTMLGKGQDFFFGGYAGTGKAQPLDAMIQTPSGAVRMGDISLGDLVFGSDGIAYPVTGVFPQGVKPAYRVTFRDGSSTTCCDDHLWNVSAGKDRKAGKYRTLPLSKIMENGILRPSGDMRYHIQLAAPVDYGWDSPALSAYLVGALLGDGYLCGSTPQISIADHEPALIEIIRGELPDGVTMTTYSQGSGCKQYRIVYSRADKENPLKDALMSLGICVHGREKFIPERYMKAPVEDRVALLRGLMDTDGSIRANRTSFASNTPALAYGVAELVRSLGGVAVIRTCERKSTGSVEFSVNVKTMFNPFRLERKASQWTPSTKNLPSRYMRSAEYIGKVEQQCIQIASPDHLYLTDDFIVTHNTTVLPAVIDSFGLAPDQVKFCAPTGKAAKVMGEKLKAFGIHETPTTIHKLIYLPKRAAADKIQAQIANLQKQIVADVMGEQNGIMWNNDFIQPKEAEAVIQKLNLDLMRAMDNNDGPKFTLRPMEDFPEECKLIVVDEGSMVGSSLAADLATFGRPILAFGDPGQLPPVNDKYGFDCEQPDAFLTEIHRQAEGNPIIRIATMARNGQELKLGDYGDGVKIVNRRDDDVTLDMDREAMVLCGTHKKRWTLTKKIRGALGFTETGPCEGEPLLFCKNSTKLETMVNGTIVTCLSDIGDLRNGNARLQIKFSDDDGGGTPYEVWAAQGLFEEHHFRKQNTYSAPSQQAFKAKRECEHLDWGHVLTCHKSQGSQWDDVVVHDESGAFRDASSRWLYTAVTRAAEKLTVVM